MKPLQPIFFFTALILIVGLACSGGATPPTQAPPPTQPVQVVQPTSPPAPTEVPPTEPPPTEAPTEPPAPQSQQFFTEEFDNWISSDWDVLTVTGSNKADPDKVNVEADGGKLVWNFDSEYVYYYMFYNAYEYEDVQLDISADNRGRNNNSISLICRYDPKVGWYEFNIANSGV
ncbi:MAG TPA: hypothetical protein VIV15_06195, partial [Anaerolineales bacterium]